MKQQRTVDQIIDTLMIAFDFQAEAVGGWVCLQEDIDWIRNQYRELVSARCANRLVAQHRAKAEWMSRVEIVASKALGTLAA